MCYNVSMADIMIDIETCGTGSEACILTVADRHLYLLTNTVFRSILYRWHI